MSNHNLSIETGRHNKIPKHKRFCPFCPSEVEDEAHFLIACHSLSHLRKQYLEPLTEIIDGFETLSLNDKFKKLMCKLDFNLYKFISEGTDLRTFLVSKFRNRD